MSDRCRYPELVEEHVSCTEAFSTSEDPARGEAPDFIFENINKSVQKWIPPNPQENIGNMPAITTA